MNLIKCDRGHYYDETRFDKCPHCESSKVRDTNVTVPVMRTDANYAVTTDLKAAQAQAQQSIDVSSQEHTAAINPAATSSLQDAVKAATDSPEHFKSAVQNDDEKTVSFHQKSLGVEPVVGWLVCTEGKHFGKDFRLKSGRNFIGRGSNMDVALVEDKSVSRDKHAVIVFEPKNCLFLMQPGDSKELSYLNDDVVLSTVQLKPYDIINLGETKLMFIPCCNEHFNWEKVENKE